MQEYSDIRAWTLMLSHTGHRHTHIYVWHILEHNTYTHSDAGCASISLLRNDRWSINISLHAQMHQIRTPHTHIHQKENLTRTICRSNFRRIICQTKILLCNICNYQFRIVHYWHKLEADTNFPMRCLRIDAMIYIYILRTNSFVTLCRRI